MFAVAAGLEPLSTNETPSSILEKIENIAYEFLHDIAFGDGCGSITMVSRTTRNALESTENGAIRLGHMKHSRRLNPRGATALARQLQVLSAVQKLLLSGKRMSQRELFYLLVESFDNQQQLNNSVLDVSAALGVPRYSIHIGAATRGVLAGCLRIALSGSTAYFDCEHVGVNGWPIPGDVHSALSVVVSSTARYILVIEKYGVFSRLVQDRFYEQMPCILICGKGYPSVATRAMTSLLAQRLRIPVLGVADFNPHGLNLLQCYCRGSVRTNIESFSFVCDVKWMALRSSHIQQYEDIGGASEQLTDRDRSILNSLQQRNTTVRTDPRYMREVEAMRALGKYELQWLYGHPEGASFLGKFLLNAILHADYF